MKKGIIIILAVAIIGAVGIHDKSSGSAHLVSPASTSAGSGTMASSGGSASTSSPASSSTSYKDGTYTGASEFTPYGPVQIAVVISGGKITDVNFLQMPSDMGHSQEVTAFSEPLLKESTLQKQNANIDFVSGATSTSEGYEMSLQAALNQAAIS